MLSTNAVSSEPRRRTLRLRCAIVAICVACILAPAVASAGSLTVNINSYVNGCGMFTFNDPYHFIAPCSGTSPMGVVGGTPWPGTPTPAGGNYWAETVAPPGITITSASVTGANISNVNNNQGWGGGSFYAGGGSPWYNGQTSEYDGPFNSSYWGFQVVCGWSSCSNPTNIYAGGIQLTAVENQGPALTAVGGNNLWYQTRPGEYVWNPPGDLWSTDLEATDSSGVCRMWASVDGRYIPGPSSVPDTSQWVQCPNRFWEPVQGASIDTRDYSPGAGGLSLEFAATNAAGVTATAGPEDLSVDNDPVGVSFQTPNDANPSVWVGHAVAIDATPTAGPSGVGGMSCSTDRGSAKAYPAGGLTVDGDGIHTVSCTAWNRAVGPQGQPNTGSGSLSVRIDEAPPSLSFAPQNPLDPTGLVVDTSDTESGVAVGSIQIAPAGSSAWTSLPASFDGAHLLAHFDDAGLHGPYNFQATSCDNVGNCATATERLTLPLRVASDSQVSLTKIINPLRKRIVRERVRVGGHWVTVRRGKRLVRVKRGGHVKIIKVVKYVERCSMHRVRTARHRWRVKRVCKAPHVHVTTVLRVPYGHEVTIRGLYTTAEGVPLGGQPVRILAAPDNNSGAFIQLGTVTTAADGAWTATLPPGPSRTIRAVTDGTATILPSSGQVTTIVPADVKLLRVWPRHVRWGGTVHLVGQLMGGYLPPGGALVRLRIGIGSARTTYGVREHVTGDGRFTTTYTFGLGVPSIRQSYWFQIASLPMGNYPYAPAASRRVSVLVGG
jgi:hypothetical protein